MTTEKSKIAPMQEQLTYANVLLWGGWLGIFLMIVSYLLYLSGVITPHVDILLVIQNWGHGVQEYLHVTDSPHGWAWVALLHRGDYLNFVGLVLLAVLTIICYLILFRGYVRKKEWAYAIICLAEVLVLSLAASGLLGSGGH
ncbi:MAG: DUF1634 domain-containing protein [Desulfovibrionaceae bacterium]|jgi:heme/copper-type cytochrome/quinol oxidase subunit 4|nr:DUF1634 domain-containing protein [Desulfovibrionaceae bacterium]